MMARDVMRTGYVFDVGMLAHQDPKDKTHPEQPERLVSIMERFESKGLLSRSQKIEMDLEDIKYVQGVHSTEHHNRMLQTASRRIPRVICLDSL